MYNEGQKVKETERSAELTSWLNTNGYYLEDVNEGIYRIAKAPVPDNETIKENLRYRRGQECFPIINRGELWYSRLTEQQRAELDIWYTAWLDVTESLSPPEMPAWLEETNEQKNHS